MTATTTPVAPVRGPGLGTAMAHHGELLQGVFDDGAGGSVRAVVTLPYPDFTATARFTPEAGGPVTVRPAWRTKARRAAEETARWIGCEVGGVLTLENDIPLERGYGSSTADVVATVRGVAAALGVRLSADEVCRIAVHAEGASDNVMLGRNAVLYANRIGAVLEEFDGPLPALEVIGVDAGGAGVDTLARGVPDYAAAELAAFSVLRRSMRWAVVYRSAAALARIATMSARINQHHLPNPAFDDAIRVCADVGAAGVQTAHTGRVIAVLLDPGDPLLERRADRAASLLDRAGLGPSRRFRACYPQAPGRPFAADRAMEVS